MNTPTNYIGDVTADTTYESERFLLRLVRESDAEDLLECYSDPAAQKLFNSDNCTSDFVYVNADELREYIRSWLEAFEHRGFYRFAIVDKTNGKAIGTIEMFGRPESQDNILRLDLPSSYENAKTLTELLELINREFYSAFDVGVVVTKAIPEAIERFKLCKTRAMRLWKRYGICPKWSIIGRAGATVPNAAKMTR